MKKKYISLKNIVLGAIIFCLLVITGAKTNAENWIVSLTILKGYLLTRATWTIDIGLINTSPVVQEITATVGADIFQVQDKVGGCSGYYTTIQADDLSYGTNKITNDNISFKTQISPSTILGALNNEVRFGNKIGNTRSNIKKPTTYFFRQMGLGCSIIGQYWDSAELKINVPANQTAGIYKGKLYYLLIDKTDLK